RPRLPSEHLALSRRIPEPGRSIQHRPRRTLCTCRLVEDAGVCLGPEWPVSNLAGPGEAGHCGAGGPGRAPVTSDFAASARIPGPAVGPAGGFGYVLASRTF